MGRWTRDSKAGPEARQAGPEALARTLHAWILSRPCARTSGGATLQASPAKSEQARASPRKPAHPDSTFTAHGPKHERHPAAISSARQRGSRITRASDVHERLANPRNQQPMLDRMNTAGEAFE